MPLPEFVPSPAKPVSVIGQPALECPGPLTAAEQMFFLDAPLAHVVEYEEHLRTVRATNRRLRALRERPSSWRAAS